MLLLLKGQPGSGKSTLGRALAGRLGWALIDKDDARDAFQPLVGAYPAIDWNSLSYSVMFNYAATQLGAGVSVILDCPLARRELYERATKVAARVRAPLCLMHRLTLLKRAAAGHTLLKCRAVQALKGCNRWAAEQGLALRARVLARNPSHLLSASLCAGGSDRGVGGVHSAGRCSVA